MSITFCICGCGKKKKPNDSLKSEVETDLYEKGLSMVDKLNSLLKDNGYAKNSGLSSEIIESYQKLQAVSYENLTDVYRVSHLQESLDTFVAIAPESMEDESKSYYREKMIRSMGNMVVSYSAGVKELALSSTMDYETSFINKQLTTAEAYIYCYQDAYPILVTFIPGSDGAVVAKASYLFVDSLINVEPEVLGDAIRGYFNASSLERITK